MQCIVNLHRGGCGRHQKFVSGKNGFDFDCVRAPHIDIVNTESTCPHSAVDSPYTALI